jgi:hypothetical protein
LPVAKRGYFFSTPQSPDVVTAQGLQAQQIDGPVALPLNFRRLRWLLKTLLRRLGLRCLSVEEVRP